MAEHAGRAGTRRIPEISGLDDVASTLAARLGSRPQAACSARRASDARRCSAAKRDARGCTDRLRGAAARHPAPALLDVALRLESAATVRARIARVMLGSETTG